MRLLPDLETAARWSHSTIFQKETLRRILSPRNTITQDEVCDWVVELEDRGLRPGTIRKIHSALHGVMKSAVLKRRIPFNSCDSVEFPEEDPSSSASCIRDEIDSLVEAMIEIGSRFRAFVLLGVFGGLRFRELAGLRRKRLNLALRTVEIVEVLIEVNGELSFGPPKTKNSVRTVALAAERGS